MSTEKNKHKESFRTWYGDFFGFQPSKLQGGEWAILKFKKFSQLEWTQFLNESMKNYLDKWQKLEAENWDSKNKNTQSMHLKSVNKSNNFKNSGCNWNIKIYQLIINALTSLSSFIKGKLPTETTQKVSYKKYDTSIIW